MLRVFGFFFRALGPEQAIGALECPGLWGFVGFFRGFGFGSA